jgi:hypothetical protein
MLFGYIPLVDIPVVDSYKPRNFTSLSFIHLFIRRITIAIRERHIKSATYRRSFKILTLSNMQKASIILNTQKDWQE